MTEILKTAKYNKIRDELIADLSKLPTIKDVYDYIEKKYPNWIIDALDKYSEDYPILAKNWEQTAKEAKVITQKIIIVKNLEADEQLVFCELLTGVGFHVSTQYEIIHCKICQNAIPSLQYYNNLKQINPTTIPENWSDKCISCRGT